MINNWKLTYDAHVHNVIEIFCNIIGLKGVVTKTRPIVVVIHPKNLCKYEQIMWKFIVKWNLFMYYHLICIDKTCCEVWNFYMPKRIFLTM